MKDTRLVQRLLRPRKVPPDRGNVRTHHVFGGAALGLTPAQWAVLDPIFEVDYMGAAEYEFGILPRTMHVLFQNKANLVGFVFVLKKRHIPVHWRRKGEPVFGSTRLKKAVAESDRDIYVLCSREQQEDVPTHITKLVKGKYCLKEGARFDVLDGHDAEDRLEGWLDLNNQFLFFSSRVMWEEACKLFDLKSNGDGFA